jgi:hypothetical protein
VVSCTRPSIFQGSTSIPQVWEAMHVLHLLPLASLDRALSSCRYLFDPSSSSSPLATPPPCSPPLRRARRMHEADIHAPYLLHAQRSGVSSTVAWTGGCWGCPRRTPRPTPPCQPWRGSLLLDASSTTSTHRLRPHHRSQEADDVGAARGPAQVQLLPKCEM